MSEPFYEPGRLEHSGMLDGGRDDSSVPCERSPCDREIVCLRSPTGEDDLQWTCRPYRSCDPFTSLLDAVLGCACRCVDPGRVPESFAEIRGHRGTHFGSHRCGCGVIEVEHQPRFWRDSRRCGDVSAVFGEDAVQERHDLTLVAGAIHVP